MCLYTSVLIHILKFAATCFRGILLAIKSVPWVCKFQYQRSIFAWQWLLSATESMLKSPQWCDQEKNGVL